MINKSKDRIKIEKTIFSEHSSKKFTWKDIKHIQFEDDDIIHIGFDEGYQSEDNSWDAHFFAEVIRMVDETDDHYNKRMKDIELDEKWARERRYESYLRLKKEFENDGNDNNTRRT